MNTRILILILIYTLYSPFYVLTQTSDTNIRIDFRVNESQLDASYNDNAKKIQQIDSTLQALRKDSTINITAVAFCGSASPEGSAQLNKRLARGRLETLKKLVRSSIDIPDSIVSYDDDYISWDYLADIIKQSDFDQKKREEILAIINSQSELIPYPGGRKIDSRVPALQSLGQETWSRLLLQVFKPMRFAHAVFSTERRQNPPRSPNTETPFITTTSLVRNASVSQIAPLSSPHTETTANTWQRHLLVKTNLAGWVLGISNIGFEIDLARHWSLSVPIYYSAWNYFKSNSKFRTLMLQPETRYWFRKNNERWFLGAHFGLAYYNFAIGKNYRTQDHDGKSPALGGGLSAGYRMPISHDGRWKLEFSAGIGIYALHHDKFRNHKDGLLVKTEKKTYYGIDQFAITLSYSFGLKKKGGRK